MTVTRRQTCRLCDSKNVERVVELDPIPLSENYSHDQDVAANAPRYPVDVFMCGDCGHVQQVDIIDPKTLWDSYTYYSGDAKGMPEHFQNISAKAIKAAAAPAGSLVVDIGSNDGSLLKPFKSAGYRVLGIDPATDAAKRANDAGIPTITSLMTRDLAKRIRNEHGPAHIVCAFNVFAHADDLGEMLASGAEQCRGKIVLDSLDESKPFVDQRRIELNQAGAGADFCQCRTAGIDAADAYKRKRALHTHIGLRHHPRRQPEQRPT